MSWNDDQFLFRLTSTFGWDEAISLCDSLALGIENAAAQSDSRRRLRRDEHDEGDEGDDDDAEEEEEEEEYYYHDGYAIYYDYFQGHNNNQNSQKQGRKTLPQWLKHAHAQLFYIDQWGNSPIHAASYVKPPTNVIEALFRVGRALWRHSSYYRRQSTPLWAIQCKDGSTPFLVACSTGASTSVLHSYLDEIEYYIERKWVHHPHLARMLVLEPDNLGNSPLMGWMDYHYGWVKRQLEQHGGGGVPTRNSNAHNNSHQFFPRGDQSLLSQSLSDYWNLAQRILLFATMNIRPHSPPATTPVLLHRCAAIAMYCPISLLEWVVAPHSYDGEGWVPADLSAATPDSCGKLPLHRAMEAVDSVSMFDEEIVHHGADFDSGAEYGVASHPINLTTMPPAEVLRSMVIVTDETVCPRDDAVLYNNPKLEKSRVQLMKKMLLWHPEAATAPFLNGRTPLIQAVAHGGTWHTMGYKSEGGDCGKDHLGVVQLLWGYAPEKLTEIDPVTKLYPYMLAASVPHRVGFDHDRDVVDTIFCLLRKDPQLVAGALIGSNSF